MKEKEERTSTNKKNIQNRNAKQVPWNNTEIKSRQVLTHVQFCSFSILLISFSSHATCPGAVFDGLKNEPYLENDITNPINAYGKSKLSGEILLKQCNSYLILRTSWVFSEKGKNFVNTIKQKLFDNKNLKIIEKYLKKYLNIIENNLKIIEKYLKK